MTSQAKLTPENISNKKGIYGFGISNNNNLDLLNLISLACAGIIIKVFFVENFSKLGNVGPASTTIWGYGLTALSLTIMIFMSIHLISSNKYIIESGNIFEFIKLIISDVLPIILTLFIIIYVIALNFIFFKRINTNRVTDSYNTYSFISSILITIQMGLIFKYLYGYLDNSSGSAQKDSNDNMLAKYATYIISTINFIFILIIHILLAFYSTDG